MIFEVVNSGFTESRKLESLLKNTYQKKKYENLDMEKAICTGNLGHIIIYQDILKCRLSNEEVKDYFISWMYSSSGERISFREFIRYIPWTDYRIRSISISVFMIMIVVKTNDYNTVSEVTSTLRLTQTALECVSIFIEVIENEYLESFRAILDLGYNDSHWMKSYIVSAVIFRNKSSLLEEIKKRKEFYNILKEHERYIK